MYRLVLLAWIVIGLIGGAAAAQEDSEADLTPGEVEIITEQDIYGQTVLMAEGELTNRSSTAYTSITLFADVLDKSSTAIGEGFGYLVDACGAALVDVTLQPGEARRFALTLELYEPDAEIDTVTITAEGIPTDPTSPDAGGFFSGVKSVTRQEVVMLEWIDESFLRYGVGCDGYVFSALDWYEYDVRGNFSTPIIHPRAEAITEAMLTQVGLTDPFVFRRSYLSFPPDARRMVYQTGINTVFTAEPDGSFKRLIFEDLARHSLHGIQWLREGRFLAYYFGAYGEPVRYFTASVDGQILSPSIYDVVPSVTVPGATGDGLRVIIGAAFDDVTGYYYKSTLYLDNELLFEAELPGNNWPAPVFTRRADGNAYIYFIRPVEEKARLQCFDMQTRELHDMTTLPLDLTPESRGWAWLSPEGERLAVAANGVNSGLWLVNLSGFMACQ